MTKYGLVIFFLSSFAFATPAMINPCEVAKQAGTKLPLNCFAGLFDNGEGLQSGRGSPIVHLIENSKDIAIEIYEMQDPSVRRALRSALARGANIRIIKEPKPLGEKCEVFTGRVLASGDDDCTDQRALVQELGDRIVPFNKGNCGQNSESKKSCFEHGKLLIATGYDDKQVALVSTGNFNASNLCDLEANPTKCNRDFSVVTQDPQVIGVLREIYDLDFKGERYDLRTLLDRHPEVAKKMTVSPFSKAPLTEFLSGAGAGCRVQVENQYLKDKELNQTLIEIAHKGARVEVTLPSPCAFDQLRPDDLPKQTALVQPFLSHGVDLRFFTKAQKIQGRDAYMHAKVILISDCKNGSPNRAWVGSVNGSTQSLDVNREFGLFITEPQQIETLQRVLSEDHRGTGSQSWTEIVNDRVNMCPLERGQRRSEQNQGRQ